MRFADIAEFEASKVPRMRLRVLQFDEEAMNSIDALASDGVKFNRAFTPVPITLSSHTVIFTGTYPTLNGMHDFSGNRLGANPPTLASILKDHGYVTGTVVGSAVLDSRLGLDHGFDFYYDHFEFNRLQRIERR
jgi:arylsulfatase A-like enzyme